MSLLYRNNITMLVCDMAGTIIKENNIIYKAMANSLKMVGYSATEEQQKSWPGLEKKEVFFKHIKNHYGKDVQPIVIMPIVDKAGDILKKELEKEYFENNNISLIDDDVLHLFENLRINGIKIALNTGYSRQMQHKIIKHFDLVNYVDDFISSEEVRHGRPFPYMIHRIMERNHILNVKNVAKIGDTLNDIKEGRNAGCGLNIGVLSGKENKDRLSGYADIVIDKITDIRNDDLPVFLL